MPPDSVYIHPNNVLVLEQHWTLPADVYPSGAGMRQCNSVEFFYLNASQLPDLSMVEFEQIFPMLTGER